MLCLITFFNAMELSVHCFIHIAYSVPRKVRMEQMYPYVIRTDNRPKTRNCLKTPPADRLERNKSDLENHLKHQSNRTSEIWKRFTSIIPLMNSVV